VPPVPPPAETTAERPWAQVDAPPAAPAPAVATAPPVPVAEAPVPRVHVSFLLYSKVPERRSVALAIEDGGLVTLHEGERTGGVEVARILPDRVELRYDGRTFAVRARD
jgi:type II secretory pathway component PulC